MNAAVVQSKAGHDWWTLTLVAAAILMVTMGARQSLGLFVSPLNTSTGLGIVTISFAMAVGPVRMGSSATDRGRSGRSLRPGPCWRAA